MTADTTLRPALHTAPREALPKAPRILILGGGYVGLYTALQLMKRLGRDEARVSVVDPRPAMTYQPFLPEAAAGALEPRHVVVPLRRVLKGVEVISARVNSISAADKRVNITPIEGHAYDVHYDVLVVALGSVSRTLPIPGLTEEGLGFKQVEEAIALRNHVLDRLDAAQSSDDEAVRRRALSFLFVGGGYAGIEGLAELEDMARSATKYYPSLSPGDLHFVLVEATDRILPEVDADLSEYTVDELRKRGIQVRLSTRLESCVGGHVVLSDGTQFESDTIVWTAGVKANPVVAESDLPLDDKGRLRANADLRVVGLDDVWTAGDVAAVPDITKDDPDALCAPSAQHAVRQARRLGDNIAAVLHGEATKDYAHKNAGSVASLGLYKGVAQIYGIKLKGFPAWFMHRTYHVSRVPTLNRKVRVVLDWTLALFFRRDVVSLGSLHTPHEEFRAAARGKVGAGAGPRAEKVS